MTTKQNQRVLMVAAITMILAALCVLAWGVWVPSNVEVPSATHTDISQANPSGQDGGANQDPSLAELQQLGSIDLRRPLRDPAPVVVAAIPLQARLIGTVEDSGNPAESMAIFKLSNGTERWFKPGQQFDDPAGQVTVDTVGRQKVAVTYQGQQRELSVNTP